MDDIPAIDYKGIILAELALGQSNNEIIARIGRRAEQRARLAFLQLSEEKKIELGGGDTAVVTK